MGVCKYFQACFYELNMLCLQLDMKLQVYLSFADKARKQKYINCSFVTPSVHCNAAISIRLELLLCYIRMSVCFLESPRLDMIDCSYWKILCVSSSLLALIYYLSLLFSIPDAIDFVKKMIQCDYLLIQCCSTHLTSVVYANPYFSIFWCKECSLSQQLFLDCVCLASSWSRPKGSHLGLLGYNCHFVRACPFCQFFARAGAYMSSLLGNCLVCNEFDQLGTFLVLRSELVFVLGIIFQLSVFMLEFWRQGNQRRGAHI